MEIYIDETTEYAVACLELIYKATEETQFATLEAILVLKEYDEKIFNSLQIV